MLGSSRLPLSDSGEESSAYKTATNIDSSDCQLGDCKTGRCSWLALDMRGPLSESAGAKSLFLTTLLRKDQRFGLGNALVPRDVLVLTSTARSILGQCSDTCSPPHCTALPVQPLCQPSPPASPALPSQTVPCVLGPVAAGPGRLRQTAAAADGTGKPTAGYLQGQGRQTQV
jgi:hypothetical protein